ncbi:MAG TPA: hypothetical protein VF015_09300, partial [Acidimicrobiales bacterium]
MTRHHRQAIAAALCATLVLATAACGGDDTDAAGTGNAGGAAAPSLDGTITVFAAASLTDAFTEAGDAFEAANPDVTVEFNF